MQNNNFPKLHNATWPGIVGKGPDSQPMASCKADHRTANAPAGLTTSGKSGASVDGSLLWSAAFTADGSRIVFVDLAQADGSFKRVHEYKVAAPTP